MKELRENTRALRQNTEALKAVADVLDRSRNLEKRRRSIKAACPYTEQQLLAFKRQDLVMLASQLGVKDTSVGQAVLVARVLEAQEG
jgi:hypothetical protein